MKKRFKNFWHGIRFMLQYTKKLNPAVFVPTFFLVILEIAKTFSSILLPQYFIDDITKDGGTERCTAVLSNLLAVRGFDVSILSINASKNRSKYEIDSNVNVKTFNLQKIENAVSRRMKTFKYLGHEIIGGVRRNCCSRYL